MLTMVTGIVDAVSYLKLGHVFVANMTGNVVFLGFAIADPQNFSIPASLVAIGAFLTGAIAGGRLSLLFGRHRGRHIMYAIVIEIALVGVTLMVSTSMIDLNGATISYALIVLLAFTMGLQNATARRIGIPDLTTTVLTLTMTGLAADSNLAGANNPNLWRRLAAVAAMFLGAALGAISVYHFGVGAALALALVPLVSAGIAAYRHSSSPAAWAVGVR
jgi:uncharacterized membrane protein YoaK (UPF0700 family)